MSPELILLAIMIAWATYEAAKLLLIADLARRQRQIADKLDEAFAQEIAKIIEERK